MREIQEQKMRAVFEVVEYLLLAGALMGVGAAVKKYAALITPKYPLSSEIAAVVIMLLGLGLSIWAGIYGVHRFGEVFRRQKFQTAAAVVLLFGSWGYVVSALFIMAIRA